MTNRRAPNIFVKVAGASNLEARLIMGKRLMSLEYTDSERKADKLRLVVDNFDLSQFDNPVWTKGNKLTVHWGYADLMGPPRTVIIKKVNGFRQLEIEAHGGESVLAELDRCRKFESVSDSDIAIKIAEEYGFGEENRFIEMTKKVHETVSQPGITDAQMLRKLATRNGFEFYIDFDGLHWHQRDMGNEAVRTITYYSSNTGDVLSLNITNGVFKRPQEVTVKSRDPDKKKTTAFSANNETVERGATAPLLDQIEGAARTIEMNAGFKIAKVPLQAAGLFWPLANAAGEVLQYAKKKWRKLNQKTVKMDMDVVGDPLYLAKTNVIVEGIGQRLSGKYYIKEAVHKITNSGYTVSLKMISDGHSGYKKSGFDELTIKSSKNKGQLGPGDVLCDITQPLLTRTGRTGVIKDHGLGEAGIERLVDKWKVNPAGCRPMPISILEAAKITSPLRDETLFPGIGPEKATEITIQIAKKLELERAKKELEAEEGPVIIEE